MSEFENAVEVVLKHEGFYSNDDDDKGGATKYGISLRFLKNLNEIDDHGYLEGDINKNGNIDETDIKALDKDKAIALYRRHFWDKYEYSRIYYQSIGTKVFSLCVNMGYYYSSLCAQRAIRSASNIEIIQDGILGSQSFSAINMSNPHLLLASIKSEAAGHYRKLVAINPNLEKYLAGWLNRAYYNTSIND